jgi:hypothetical protein
MLSTSHLRLMDATAGVGFDLTPRTRTRYSAPAATHLDHPSSNRRVCTHCDCSARTFALERVRDPRVSTRCSLCVGACPRHRPRMLTPGSGRLCVHSTTHAPSIHPPRICPPFALHLPSIHPPRICPPFALHLPSIHPPRICPPFALHLPSIHPPRICPPFALHLPSIHPPHYCGTSRCASMCHGQR